MLMSRRRSLAFKLPVLAALLLPTLACSLSLDEPIVASKLRISRFAAGAVSGAAFTTQPIVEFTDPDFNVAIYKTGDVSVTVDGGATIMGLATAMATSGYAKFTGIGIRGTAGTSYTLTFSSPGVASTTQTIVLASPTLASATLASPRRATTLRDRLKPQHLRGTLCRHNGCRQVVVGYSRQSPYSTETPADDVEFDEPGDYVLPGARALDGLKVHVDPVGNRLIDAGHAPETIFGERS